MKYHLSGLKFLLILTIAQIWTSAAVAAPNSSQSDSDSQALVNLDTALQQDPRNIDAYIERGLLHAKLNQNLAAVTDYSTVIQLDPNRAIAYNNRAIAKVNLRDYWGAYQDYTQVVRIRPEQAITYNNRAVVRQKLGDCKGSIADLRIAAELFRLQGDPVNYQRTLANLKFFQRSGKG